LIKSQQLYIDDAFSASAIAGGN